MLTSSGWDEIYKKGSTPWRDSADLELEKVLENTNIFSGNALDLGCGTGERAKFLFDKEFVVEALDFSNEALEIAHKLSFGPDYVYYDLEHLDQYNFKHKNYDLILDVKVLAFIKDKNKYLQTISSKLTGCFFLQVFIELEDRPELVLDKDQLENLLQKYFIISKCEVKRNPEKKRAMAEYYLKNKI